MNAPEEAPDEVQGDMPRWVTRLMGREGIALACVWGFAEGTLFFVVPDVLVSLAALCGGRRALPHVVAAVAGALLAGAVMFAWSASDEPAASAAVRNVPFVRETMFARVDEGLETEEALALFSWPGSMRRCGFRSTSSTGVWCEIPSRARPALDLLPAWVKPPCRASTA
jgi:hypothetical protein